MVDDLLSVDRAQARARTTHELAPTIQRLLQGGESYAALTILQICEEAGFPRSTFYLHFRDKGDLLVALAEDVTANVLSSAEAWWNSPPTISRAELGAVIGNLVAAYRENEALLAAVMDSVAYNPAVAEAFFGLVETIRTGLTAHIVGGQRIGAFDPRFDADSAAGWLVFMFERGLHHLVRGVSDDVARAHADTVAEFLWRSLYSSGRGGHS